MANVRSWLVDQNALWLADDVYLFNKAYVSLLNTGVFELNLLSFQQPTAVKDYMQVSIRHIRDNCYEIMRLHAFRFAQIEGGRHYIALRDWMKEHYPPPSMNFILDSPPVHLVNRPWIAPSVEPISTTPPAGYSEPTPIVSPVETSSSMDETSAFSSESSDWVHADPVSPPYVPKSPTPPPTTDSATPPPSLRTPTPTPPPRVESPTPHIRSYISSSDNWEKGKAWGARKSPVEVWRDEANWVGEKPDGSGPITPPHSPAKTVTRPPLAPLLIPTSTGLTHPSPIIVDTPSPVKEAPIPLLLHADEDGTLHFDIPEVYDVYCGNSFHPRGKPDHATWRVTTMDMNMATDENDTVPYDVCDLCVQSKKIHGCKVISKYKIKDTDQRGPSFWQNPRPERSASPVKPQASSSRYREPTPAPATFWKQGKKITFGTTNDPDTRIGRPSRRPRHRENPRRTKSRD